MKVFHKEPQTWSAAESVCEAFGSHLASIGSQVENDAVAALLRSASVSAAWIGLTDVEEEDTFVWSDGAPLAFSSWGVGQPNDLSHGDNCASYSGEDCTLITVTGWFDSRCEVGGAAPGGEGELPGQPGCYPVKRPFVCSKPALPGTT